MYNHDKTVAELKKRIAGCECQHLDLTLKCGDKVSIDYVFKKVWFAKYEQFAHWRTFDELADFLIEYPKKAEELKAAEDDYVATEEPKLRAYFAKHFAGKTFDEISESAELCMMWDMYSDWHKEVFGYRPHAVVCGEYVSPY